MGFTETPLPQPLSRDNATSVPRLYSVGSTTRPIQGASLPKMASTHWLVAVANMWPPVCPLPPQEGKEGARLEPVLVQKQMNSIRTDKF